LKSDKEGHAAAKKLDKAFAKLDKVLRKEMWNLVSVVDECEIDKINEDGAWYHLKDALAASFDKATKYSGL